MAVEHSPDDKRGRFGAFPQIGVPIGLLLASGVLALMTGVISPGDAFLEWGWRIPFLLSFVLIIVGIVVRRAVDESPVFQDRRARRRRQDPDPDAVPQALAARPARGAHLRRQQRRRLHDHGRVPAELRDHARRGRRPRRHGAHPGAARRRRRVDRLAHHDVRRRRLSDRIGRKNTYIIGWIAFLATVFVLFPLTNTGNPWLLFLGVSLFAIGNGFTYGQQAAYFTELFPASIRYSGVSITYAIGAILGGAFAPTIAAWLVQSTGTATSVAFYIAGVMVIAFVATLLLRDRTGIPLGPDHEQEQSTRHFVWEK